MYISYVYVYIYFMHMCIYVYFKKDLSPASVNIKKTSEENGLFMNARCNAKFKV